MCRDNEVFLKDMSSFVRSMESKSVAAGWGVFFKGELLESFDFEFPDLQWGRVSQDLLVVPRSMLDLLDSAGVFEEWRQHCGASIELWEDDTWELPVVRQLASYIASSRVDSLRELSQLSASQRVEVWECVEALGVFLQDAASRGEAVSVSL